MNRVYLHALPTHRHHLTFSTDHRTRRRVPAAIRVIRSARSRATRLTTPRVRRHLETVPLDPIKIDLKVTTAAWYGSVVETYIVPHLDDLPMASVDEGRINKLYRYLLTRRGKG